MIDDLRRLPLHGLIRRLPRSNTYVLTSEGVRIAVFYTELQNRSYDRSFADRPPAKIDIRRPESLRERRQPSRPWCTTHAA